MIQRALSAIVALLVLSVPSITWGAACAESPSGQQNCEVLSARDQNALPTPRANYVTFLDNNATIENAVPTPAAGECIFGDSVSNATDDFDFTCAGTLNLKRVVLDAGTAAAGTAPLKFTDQTGALLSTVEPGAIEYANKTFLLSNYLVRRAAVQSQEVITSDVTVANTVTETTIFTQPHGANYLVVGKMEEIMLYGAISSLSGVGSNTLTVRVKYAGSTIGSFVLVEAARASVGWKMEVVTTVRAIGAGTTSIQLHANFDLNGTAVDNMVNVLTGSLDSTAAQPTTVTFEWSDADAGNTVSVLQGRALSIDDN